MTAPEPHEAVAVAEVGKALRGSRLFYGTHSDRWLDQEWQQEFWKEAAQIALDAFAPLIAERVRAAAVEALREAADEIKAGVLPSHPSSHYRDGFARAAQIVLDRADRRAER